MRKHQEVGRGLRLCVRQDGERMDESVLGDGVHSVNVLTVKYYDEKKSGQVKFAQCIEGFETGVVKILDTIYDPRSTMPQYNRGKVDAHLQSDKLAIKEFRALWESINTQTVYKVDMDSDVIVKAQCPMTYWGCWWPRQG